MPMHRRRLREVIDHRDSHGLVAREDDCRARNRDRIRRRFEVALLEDISEARLRAEPVGRRLHHQPEWSLGCGNSRRSCSWPWLCSDAEHQRAHAMHRVVHAVRVGSRIRRIHRVIRGRVKGKMAVEEPVARASRGPFHRHGSTRQHQLSHGEGLPAGRIGRVRPRISPRLDAEKDTMKVHGVRAARCVDPAPRHRVPGHGGDRLGVGPAAAIDGHDVPVLGIVLSVPLHMASTKMRSCGVAPGGSTTYAPANWLSSHSRVSIVALVVVPQ